MSELEIQSQKHNVGTIVTYKHVFITDQLVLKYFAAPILNAIRSKIKNARSVSSKHFSIDYWVPILEQMFSMNLSARRENSPITVIDMNTPQQSFQWLLGYSITDYSLSDAGMINNIVNNYTDIMIQKAINTAKSNGIYNMQYINAILEKAKAMNQIENNKINRLAEKAENSSSILDRQKIHHTPIDIAIAQYNWQKAQEDAELERKFNELMK